MFSTAARSLPVSGQSLARATAYSDGICTVDLDTRGEANALHVEGTVADVRQALAAMLTALDRAEGNLVGRSYGNGTA